MGELVSDPISGYPHIELAIVLTWLCVVVVGWIDDVEELLVDANVLLFIDVATRSIWNPISTKGIVELAKPRRPGGVALHGVKESWANPVPFKAESPWDFSCSQVFIFSDQRFPNIVWVSNESVVEEGLDHTDLLSVLVMILAELREINNR